MLPHAITLPPEKRWSNWPWLELMTLRRLRSTQYRVTLPGLPPSMDGLRILQLSDIHIREKWMPAWDKLLRDIAECPPDLLLLTGDLVDRKHDHRPAVPLVERFVDGLTARLGVWSILGNHDTELLPLRFFSDKVHLLCNEIVSLHDGDATLELAGVHGVAPQDYAELSPPGFGIKPSGVVRIVLAHYPSQGPSLIAAGADVVFTGHTHGGQVCLPGGLPIITHDALPRRFARGVHKINGGILAVSRGAGFSMFPIRFFCPAEVIEITLVSPKTQLV